MKFDGIPLAALDFYEDLETDNSKSFWTAHKHVYDESVRAPLEALAAELEPKFGPAKLFRPYRDVRFSKGQDARTRQRRVRTSATPRCTCRSRPPVCSSPAATGRRVRRRSTGCGARPRTTWRAQNSPRVLAGVRRRKLDIRGEQLTRVPTGYPKDHPHADLLRYKTLTASRELGAPAWLSTPAARTEILKAWRGITPLVAWLETHVGRD